MNNQALFKMLEGQNIKEKYYLKKLLNVGEFEGVYLADKVVKHRVITELAIKLIIADDPDKQLDELIFSTTLNHPNLINCFTCGECSFNGNDFLYLLMEKADYSLEDELKKGNLSEEKVKQLVLDIANGLDYLHSKKPVIVHRNLNPRSILRVGNKWKISDFGLVMSLQGTPTRNNMIMSSVAYSPPEAYEGKISTGWDIWLLGVVIYEALTGKFLFDSNSPLQLMPQLADLEPDFSFISDYWQEIIKSCLINDHKQRFSSENLLDKLQEKFEVKNDNLSNKINNINPDEHIDLLLKKADSLKESKQYQESIDLYNQVIELNPNSANAYVNRGSAYHNLKEYEKAIADYNQAIELNPSDFKTYVNRGTVYYDLKEYEKAIADHNQAIELDRNYTTAYFNRGTIYYDLKEYGKAIADYNQAIELNSDYANAYVNRGLAYYYLKEYDKAIADYNQAIELDPNSATAYVNRGLAYYYLKEYDKVIADYNQAIELDPNDAIAYNNRGTVYDHLNKHYSAIGDYSRAIKADTNYAAAYHNRGLAYYYLKEYEKAIADYNQAIELDPNRQLSRDNLKIVQKKVAKMKEN